MDKITEEGEDWLTVLKVAIQIYNGDIRGFALLPAAQEERKAFMQEYMKRLLKTSIESVVNKHYHSNPQDETEDQQQDDK